MQALPYPAIKGEEGAAIRAVESRILPTLPSPSEKICQFNSAKGSIATYFREGWNAGVVAVAFEAVTGWASRNGIAAERIILGEFGATGAPLARVRGRDGCWTFDALPSAGSFAGQSGNSAGLAAWRLSMAATKTSWIA
jgi:hypothetical protein